MEHSSTAVQQNLSVVAFRLDRHAFALPLEVVMQILPMMTITAVPHSNKSVKGTINVRGKDVLVVNLRSHLGFDEESPQLYTPILLLNLHHRSLAFIVDAVMDVMTVPLQTVTNVKDIIPDGIEGIPQLRGFAHQDDETVLVLDPDHLFESHNRHAEAITNAPDAEATPEGNQ